LQDIFLGEAQFIYIQNVQGAGLKMSLFSYRLAFLCTERPSFWGNVGGKLQRLGGNVPVGPPQANPKNRHWVLEERWAT